MVDCEKFTQILAEGDDVSADDRDAAREHAAVCGECRHVGEAFAAFEDEQAEVAPAPAGFASRVVARLPLGPERRPLALPARVNLLPAWIFSGVAAAVGAVLVGVVAYFAYTDPVGFAAAANAFTNMPAVDVTTFGSIVGATAAAAVVAGLLGYYYLVPTE
jgi:anti-sigma-K factor RskA